YRELMYGHGIGVYTIIRNKKPSELSQLDKCRVSEHVEAHFALLVALTQRGDAAYPDVLQGMAFAALAMKFGSYDPATFENRKIWERDWVTGESHRFDALTKDNAQRGASERAEVQRHAREVFIGFSLYSVYLEIEADPLTTVGPIPHHIDTQDGDNPRHA